MIKTVLNLEAYLQNCLSCQKYLFAKTPMFCEICWKRLFVFSKLNVQRSFWTHYLIQWNIKNHFEVRSLIYSMKEGKNLRAAEFLAKNLALMIAKNDHHKHAILVPVPSSKRGQKNHANVLAMKVSGYLGLPVKDCLEWVNKQSSHKSSSKAERFKARMRVADLTFDWCNKNIILIDDVITTGATVRAAFLAFQSPKVFCCYALCCKSLS